MKQLKTDISYFLTNKIYCILVGLSALGAYGFRITHPAIGIDDTAIPLYFEDGIAPAMGRWFLFLLNKFISLSNFQPWLAELAAVLILIISVTLWCVLFRKILNDRVSIWGYAFFAGIFMTCPLISEVFVYYLHNGLCIAYGVTALSLICVLEAMRKNNNNAKRALYIVKAIIGMVISIGCYESFILVYAIGMIMMYCLLRVCAKEKGNALQYEIITWKWIVALAFTGITAVILRSLVLNIMQFIFGYHIPENYSVNFRSVFEAWGLGLSEKFMVIKKFWVMYYLNAFVYLSITVLVFAIIFLLIYSLIYIKDVTILLGILTIIAIPVVMSVFEGYPTHYRTSQYVPLVSAFPVLIIFMELGKRKLKKWISAIGGIILCCLLYNQCADMNKWFYINELKYQDALNTMKWIAYELEKDYDTTKPIIIRGPYRVPYEIAKDAYCSFDSKEYQIMSRIANLVDEHLLEKFNAEDGNGYAFAETPINSTLRWGITAFDGTNGQLIEFWNMHGYSFQTETDLGKISDAEDMRVNMTVFPKEGSILELEDYIIVNIAE